jgi:hypothetical protein
LLRNSVRDLWIAVQKLYCLRFCGCRGRMLRSLCPQLLAGRCLVFLNNLVGNLVQNRVLVLTLYSNNTGQQYATQRQDDRFLPHRFSLSLSLSLVNRVNSILRPLIEHLLNGFSYYLLVLVAIVAQRVL